MSDARTISDLKQRQSLPLGAKVNMTKSRIIEWVREFGEDGVYVSFSGGKDSTVLLHIVREMFPNIEVVFVDTGLEFPEIRSFVRQHENITILRPEMGFKDVICKYGYPILSKVIAHNIWVARRNPDGKIAKTAFSKEKPGRYNMYKWRELTKTDFIVSEKCCDIMKKKPLKMIKKASIVATMAEESINRRDIWLKYGCNMFDAKSPKSTPMSFWTEQDVLLYIHEHDLKIASVYGDVIPENGQLPIISGDCKFCTTGCHRTGCIFCGFGAHLEKGEGRFQMLKRTHKKLYDYCIGGGAYDSKDGFWKPDKNGLGMAHVFDELNKLYGESFIRYK